jgi:2-methylisocitrate lyase-like PEP mutase family enzyme
MSERAAEFRRLHVPGDPLRLLNAWDGASAKVFERAGARALGTTSAGVAYALGRPDGGRLTRDELVAATARIVEAVNIPVSADIEDGYGESPDAVAETVRRIAAAGAVGVNIEDVGALDGLYDLDAQIARLEAARAGAEREGVALFINARTDLYLQAIGADSERLDAATHRLRAYVAAGADGVFVPGVADPDVIAALVAATPAPLNILVRSPMRGVAELARLGVARISVGSAPSRAALALLGRIAGEFLGAGSFASMTSDLVAYDEANRLFG